METVWKFTYLGDMVSAGEGCETAVTARTRCGWVNFRECGELLYVYESYVRPAILFGSEAWCLKESEMRIRRSTDRCMMRAMCGV